MKSTKTERTHAEQVSAAIDQMLDDPNTKSGGLAFGDAELLTTAQSLARLPSLLGPVDPVFEQQVMHRVRTGLAQKDTRPRFRMGWAVAGLAAVILLVMLFTPWGQTAVASFMAVFNLGRTEVRITPVNTPSFPEATAAAGSAVIKESLTLEQARSQVHFAIPQPGYLPSGYELSEATAYTYPDLPAWIPQPFFVELVYLDSQGDELKLRIYPIMLGEGASISGINQQAAPIRDVQDVDVNGQPGVLLQLGSERAEATWQEVVWEQDDLILALSALHLSEADLLRIARSVR
jgi:hypothetical protein